MDPYTPQMLRYGVKAVIGKGERGEATREAFVRHGAVYFVASGAARPIWRLHKGVTVVPTRPGTESVKRLVVENLPLTVAVGARERFYVEGGSATWKASGSRAKKD
jgi:tartrate dehydratase beta subunit/fumarate hydratase class I family protein